MTEQSPTRDGLVVMPFADGRRTVVVVAGEAAVSTAPRLHDQVVGSLAYRARSLVLDLTDLGFCDLHGVDALRAAVQEAEARGVSVSLRGPSPQVAQMLRTYGRHP